MWCSGESAGLPPRSPGFVSRMSMCVEFVVGSPPCSERGFFTGLSVFPLYSITNIPNSNSMWYWCPRLVIQHNRTRKKLRVRFCSIAEHNRIRWIKFDCVRLKFCSGFGRPETPGRWTVTLTTRAGLDSLSRKFSFFFFNLKTERT